MALPLLPLVVGAGAGVLLLLKKKAPVKQQPKPAPKTDALAKKEPDSLLAGDMGKVINGAYSLLSTGVALVGTVATAAGVAGSVAAGYVAAIAVIVVYAVVLVVRGVQDANWVSEALAKGEQGLLKDLGALYGQIGKKMVEGGKFTYDNAHAYCFGAANAYNDLAYLCVGNIPWGNAFTGWSAHYEYWRQRAMFLTPPVANQLWAEIRNVMQMTREPVESAEYNKWYSSGYEFGLLMFMWLAGRASMVEKWHYDWLIVKTMRTESIGGFDIDTTGDKISTIGGLYTYWFASGATGRGQNSPALASQIGPVSRGGVIFGHGAPPAETDSTHTIQTFSTLVLDYTASRDNKIAITDLGGKAVT